MTSTATNLGDALAAAGVRHCFGVPDSVLAEMVAGWSEAGSLLHHRVCANEGGAVGCAIGSFLASGAPAVVYLQSSGLGNALNPLVSAAVPEVAGTPMVLVIGWRGEPGQTDEPQHRVQGAILRGQLDALGIPHRILDEGKAAAEAAPWAVSLAVRRRGPAALVVRPAPAGRRGAPRHARRGGLLREDVLLAVRAWDDEATFYVTTTGYTSRQWHQLVQQRGGTLGARTFYNVGSMGHAFSIAMGFAMARGSSSRTVCIDGDGAALMHLGQMAMAHVRPAPRLVHVLVQNGVHESVGGSPTAHPWVDFAALGSALGYVAAASVDSLPALHAALAGACTGDGLQLLVVRCEPGTSGPLPRPAATPAENVAQIRQALTRCASQGVEP